MPQDSSIVMKFANTIVREVQNDPSREKDVLNNSARLRENFKTLKARTGEDCDLELVFVALGIADSDAKYIKLSIAKDEPIYDILETYELSTLLFRFKGNWNFAWNSIESELTKTGEYGPARTETIEVLHKAFNEIRKSFENVKSYRLISFDNIVRTNEGKLVLIFHT
jgi:hypothetical protein